MLLSVNFHYIRDPGDYPYPGVFATSPEELRAQLLEIGSVFEFISIEHLIRALESLEGLPAKACLVTFDDGLHEQYVSAAPVLDELQIPGAFFACTLPLCERAVLRVHKLHHIMATHSPESLHDLVEEAASRLSVRLDFEGVDLERAEQQYLYDSPALRRIKYLLNHMMPPPDSSKIVDWIFSLERDEVDLSTSLYMNRVELADLAERHYVGSHAHSHRPLASLSRAEQSKELSLSKTVIEEITGREVLAVSYPYGGPSAVSLSVAAAAALVGYRAGLTMERSLNLTLQAPLLLARVSANDAPGGKAPLISASPKGLATQLPCVDSRKQYVDEKATIVENAR